MRVTSTNRNKRRKIPRETMNQEVDKGKVSSDWLPHGACSEAGIQVMDGRDKEQ